LQLFANTCVKRYVQDVKREDLLAFIRKLYELKCGPRTACNRAVIVSQLLKASGITKRNVSALDPFLNDLPLLFRSSIYTRFLPMLPPVGRP
jgi:hypothetical protein